MAHTITHSPLRIGVITDIHWTIETLETLENDPAAAAIAVAELRASVAFWQRNHVDVVLQLGDLITGNELHKQEELQQAITLLQQFSGTIRHVLGNHCLALPRKELMAALGLAAPYYTFAISGFRFIVLDGMDVSALRTPAVPEDREALARFLATPELYNYCGAIGIEQKQWLQHELKNAEHLNEHVIILCHFPLLPETTDKKYSLLWNHREIVTMLSASASVKACISGHFHYGGYARQNGIHFVVLPAFVNRHQHPSFHYGLIELFPDRLVLRNQQNAMVHNLSFG